MLGLDGVRQRAEKDKTIRFTALLHHVTQAQLRQSYEALSPKAAPGADGVTWAMYGNNLIDNVKHLHAKVHNGKYRARTDKGCPQGSVISPLLANIYLHYVLDLWFKAYRQRKARGEVIFVRYLHALRRRSQRSRLTWCRYAKLIKLYIPPVKQNLRMNLILLVKSPTR